MGCTRGLRLKFIFINISILSFILQIILSLIKSILYYKVIDILYFMYDIGIRKCTRSVFRYILYTYKLGIIESIIRSNTYNPIGYLYVLLFYYLVIIIIQYLL